MLRETRDPLAGEFLRTGMYFATSYTDINMVFT